MGGADDLPKRASSPLKRPASDLEQESGDGVDDVDMVTVPSSSLSETVDAPLQLASTARAQSVDMLADESRTQDTNPPNPVRPISPASEVPPIDTQIKTVTALIQAQNEQQLAEGTKAYLVSRRWMNKVISRGTEARQTSKEEPKGQVGPVDNSDIIQQIINDYDGVDFVQLKQGMGVENFELFPEDAWNMVVEWYGLMPGSIPIERFSHNTNPDRNGIPNVQFEFHPLILKIHRLFSDHSPIPIPQKLKAQNSFAPIVIVSRSSKYVDFLRKAKTATQIEMLKKVRVWRVPRFQPAAEPIAPAGAMETPPTSRPGSPSPNGPAANTLRAPQDSWTQVLLDVVSFTKLEKGTGRELVESLDVSANPKYNGSSDLAQFGIGDDETIVLDESINTIDFVSTYSAKSAASTALTRTSASTSQPNSGRTSPAPSGPLTRGRAQRNGRVPGTVGLSNLGNTCYMNSALQCVRSVEELTKYFLSGIAKSEINYENLLGYHGEIALAYGRLLEEMYKEPVPASFAPRTFKNIIGKHAPSFSGYGQQDSQEFLGFLIDGLQEDLSRVKKKPYIEKPDSTDEMINNLEALREMAAKVWDITKQRDDSVIADLFTGMYKSTVVCPECDKISITFDPFNNFTLQLPIENIWSHTVFYVPLNDKPVLIDVDISKQASIATLKEFISIRVGVPAERLFAAEEFKSKFYKVYSNSGVVSEEISANDRCVVFELETKPTNWPARKLPRKKTSYHHESDDEVPAWDDPMASKMLIPVFHRRPNGARSARFGSRKAWALVGVPHFVILTPEEARSEEAIKRKVLEKLAPLTTWSELHEDDDESRTSASGSSETDLVVTTGSDADSSGGAKVVASSVDGEEELVNVTNHETSGATQTQDIPKIIPTSGSYRTFNSRRPKFLDPKEYLNPAAAGLFDLCYLASSGKEMIPTGWSAVDEDKSYPTLSSRLPRLTEPEEEEGNESNHSGYGQNDNSDSSDDDDLLRNDGGVSTRMVDESDEDEDDPIPRVQQRALPVRPAPLNSGVRVGYNKSKRRQIKTYSRKGQQKGLRKFQKAPERDELAPQPVDDGPLLRLGEALIIDWRDEAYETLFEGDPNDNLRGRNTWETLEKLEDPALAAKKVARQQRRKHGITLDDCLDEFGKEEILSEQDMWYCPRCKEHRRASKKFELWKTPDVLIVHLKRFSSSGFRRDKLDVLVDFPMEGLDLTSRVIEREEGKTEVYDLFAVDDHWGGLGGGHYTAFAKNFNDHEWYEYNDSSVSKVSDPTRVVSASAYLLFYRRRSDEPLGGPKLKQIVLNYNQPPSTEPSDDEEKEEDTESGEDRGLVGNSSRNGSSSPFKGAGVTRLQKGGLGASKLNQVGTIDPAELEQLPAYQVHESNPEAAPVLKRDAIMNDALQASIEEDEGIGMDTTTDDDYSGNTFTRTSYDPLGRPNWAWNPINTDHMAINRNTRGNMISGTGSDADIASDIVDDNSSVSSGTRRTRFDEFDNADDEGFEDPSPVPDMDEDQLASGVALQHEILEQREYAPIEQVLDEVDPVGHGDVEDLPATEIHITDSEELKID